LVVSTVMGEEEELREREERETGAVMRWVG
jgi:hypothetical protein